MGRKRESKQTKVLDSQLIYTYITRPLGMRIAAAFSSSCARVSVRLYATRRGARVPLVAGRERDAAN